MSKYGSEWIETELLLAEINGDQEEIQRLGREMLPGERRRLIDQLDNLERKLSRISRLLQEAGNEPGA